MPGSCFLTHTCTRTALEACQDGLSPQGGGEEQESPRAVPSAFTRVTVPEGAATRGTGGDSLFSQPPGSEGPGP